MPPGIDGEKGCLDGKTCRPTLRTFLNSSGKKGLSHEGRSRNLGKEINIGGRKKKEKTLIPFKGWEK